MSAPFSMALMVAAPYFISPWVSVGPSSMTSTLFPLRLSSSSAVMTMLAGIILASGLILRTFSLTFWTFDGSAVFTLLTTTMSAILTLVSPG